MASLALVASLCALHVNNDDFKIESNCQTACLSLWATAAPSAHAGCCRPKTSLLAPFHLPLGVCCCC